MDPDPVGSETFSRIRIRIGKKFLFIKKIPIKSLYLVIICNLTYLQEGNTKVKFMLRIFEKFMWGPDTDPKPTKK